MIRYEKEEDMPIGEIKMVEGKDIVHHLVCKGSRRHACWYDNNGRRCIVPNCEINY